MAVGEGVGRWKRGSVGAGSVEAWKLELTTSGPPTSRGRSAVRQETPGPRRPVPAIEALNSSFKLPASALLRFYASTPLPSCRSASRPFAAPPAGVLQDHALA